MLFIQYVFVYVHQSRVDQINVNLNRQQNENETGNDNVNDINTKGNVINMDWDFFTQKNTDDIACVQCDWTLNPINDCVDDLLAKRKQV